MNFQWGVYFAIGFVLELSEYNDTHLWKYTDTHCGILWLHALKRINFSSLGVKGQGPTKQQHHSIKKNVHKQNNQIRYHIDSTLNQQICFTVSSQYLRIISRLFFSHFCSFHLMLFKSPTPFCSDESGVRFHVKAEPAFRAATTLDSSGRGDPTRL